MTDIVQESDISKLQQYPPSTKDSMHPSEVLIELNIRLDVRGVQHPQQGLEARTADVIDSICVLVPCADVQSRRCDFEIDGDVVPCLAVRVCGPGLDSQDWTVLSDRFQQDCIAVWNNTHERGQLVGVRADFWGAFDIRKFRRF